MVPYYSVYTLPISRKGHFTMLRYELLMLSIPEITQDEAKTIESQIDRTVREAKGSTISFDRWGKYRLAYPVKKNDYGVYFLTRFEIEENSGPLLQELESVFAVKLNDIVVRHMICKLDPTASLEYQKPQSLEEAPARDMGSFLRENKMGGLMGSDRPSLGDEEDDLDIEIEDEEA